MKQTICRDCIHVDTGGNPVTSTWICYKHPKRELADPIGGHITSDFSWWKCYFINHGNCPDFKQRPEYQKGK